MKTDKKEDFTKKTKRTQKREELTTDKDDNTDKKDFYHRDAEDTEKK